MNALNEREEGIQGALDAAENAKLEMQNLQADNEKLLKEARAERELMLKEAREMKAKMIDDAKFRGNSSCRSNDLTSTSCYRSRT